jgi:hypothetical protein
LHIYTTLDLEIQEIAQEIVARRVAEVGATYNINNGALVAMKPGTAEILAMVGSIDYQNEAVDGQVNVVTSLRQPGSAIKPILFATALNDGLISPATVIWDTPVNYEIAGQPDYAPRNYDREYHGPVTARVALANSYNIPAVKLLAQLGVERMLQSAQTMGIQSLFRGPDWYGLSLTLGGGEVTLLDLATAYHTIANNGVYLEPRPILAVADSSGRSMMDNLASGQRRQAISERAAFLLTDMMSDNNARVPMFGADSWLNLSLPVAAKTGTTDDNRDNWTMGFSRYLLTGVWVGNTQGIPMRSNATGIGTAGPIWNEFMNTVMNDPDLRARIGAPDDPAAWEFTPPADVELVDACPAGLVCREGGEYFARDWLALSTATGGPLSDSVVTAPSLSVYRNGQLIGYCLADTGIVRTLVRLPARFGLPGALQLLADELTEAGEKQASINAIITGDTNTLPSLDEITMVDLAINARQLDEERQNERRQALSYAGRVRGQISLGPCDEVGSWLGAVSIARNELGSSSETLVRTPMQPVPVIPEVVAIAEPEATSTPTPLPTITEEQVETPTPTLTPAGLQAPVPQVAEQNRYQLSTLYHGDNCPGGYVMGRVVNNNGGPVAGIRISMVDGWGNYYEAMSKSGDADFGSFDFPLYSDTPQDLKLTVLDGNGNPISRTYVVPHNQNPDSRQPCHFVTFQGG